MLLARKLDQKTSRLLESFCRNYSSFTNEPICILINHHCRRCIARESMIIDSSNSITMKKNEYSVLEIKVIMVSVSTWIAIDVWLIQKLLAITKMQKVIYSLQKSSWNPCGWQIEMKVLQRYQCIGFTQKIKSKFMWWSGKPLTICPFFITFDFIFFRNRLLN
jgi:hypothetical protein